MRISAAIMASPERKEHAEALYHKLKVMRFTSLVLIYDDGNGEWATGEAALRHFDGSATHHIVLQDDAVIGKHFYANVVKALTALPTQSLLSLYLGKSRPYADKVKMAFNIATITGSSFISTPALLWGVGFVIPVKDILSMLEYTKQYRSSLYDTRIGLYYRDMGQPVYYSTTSLVDHNDSLPSLMQHDKPNTEPRVAHNFAGDEKLRFNSLVQPL